MKNKSFLAVLFIFFCVNLYSQTGLLPYDMVTNVRFSERYDGSYKVDIYYNLRNDLGPNMYVSMQASIDTGVTWNFSCNQLSGDIGSGVSAGTDKHIVWNFGAEHPNYYTNQARIKVLATDSLQPCPGMPSLVHGGQLYHTILIGSQCWLRENLNIGNFINGSQNQSDNGMVEKYCYDNDTNNCRSYGGLYQWYEAMNYINVSNTQGICPNGWHMPSFSEFLACSTAVGGNSNALKAIGTGTGSGAGTNSSGFSAVFTGFRNIDGLFYSLSNTTDYWSSSESSATNAQAMFPSHTDGVIGFYSPNKGSGFTVRCIKN